MKHLDGRAAASPMTLLLLPALLLFPGCGDAGSPEVEPVVSDSAGVRVHEFPGMVLERPAPLRLADEPTVRIGVVEGASEYQWTRPVAGARLSDGGFAVLEQAPAEVRIFDPAGRFLGRAGGEGDGPGEFRSPLGLAALPGDTLLVWDPRSRRLSWFSREGSLERELSVREPGGIRSVRQVALLPGGEVVVLGARTTEEDLANQGQVREFWEVVPLGSDGDPRPSLGVTPGTERLILMDRSEAGQILSIQVQGRWWWGEGFAAASPRGVWTADRQALELRHFDLQGGLDRVVRVGALGRPLTRALIDSLHAVELSRVQDPELQDRWRADFQSREYPERVPPVAGLFGDGVGRVWVGLTAPPPERLPSGVLPALPRWLVLEEDPTGGEGGRPELQMLGVLTLPRWSHPLWADAEGALLLRNDEELGVAYVEWYPYMEG